MQIDTFVNKKICKFKILTLNMIQKFKYSSISLTNKLNNLASKIDSKIDK